MITRMITLSPMQNESRRIKTIALDSRFAAFIKRIMQLSDGRFMLTLTKDGQCIDFTIMELGDVERIGSMERQRFDT